MAPVINQPESISIERENENLPGARAGSRGRAGVGEGILNTLSNAMNLLMFAPLLAGLLGWTSRKAPTAIRPHLEKATGVVKLIDTPATEFHQATSEVFGASSKIATAAKQASGTIAQYAQKTLGQDIPQRLGQHSVSSLLTSGTFAAVGTARLTAGAFSRIGTLKDIYRNLTGKNISTLRLIVGNNLPPLIKTARREAFGGGALLGMATQLAEIGTNLYFLGAKKPPGFLTMMGLNMGLSMAPALFTSGHTALAAYKAAKDNAGQIPGEIYQGLIGGLAPNNTSAGAVEELARLCSARKVSSVDVLRLVNEAFYSHKPAIGAATARLAARRDYGTARTYQNSFSG